MLGPLIFKFLGDLRPFFSLLKNELGNKPIFSSLPLPSKLFLAVLLLIRVKMIEPPFSTLFPCSEVSFLAVDEEFSCDLVPFIAVGFLSTLIN